MKIEKATLDMFPFVKSITQDTIGEIYPHYYPIGAVNFFKAHHSDKSIRDDINSGNVFLLFDDDNPIATVTIKDNQISRLFVLNEYQKKGYGKALLDYAERLISYTHSEVVLEASFLAKHIYLKRGYIDKEYHTIKAENGDYLCYDVMSKLL